MLSDADLRRLPVEQVNWEEAREFADRLNEKAPLPGHEYRLPSEAEWEAACRNGDSSKDASAFSFYLDRPANDLTASQANFNQHLGRTSPVGSYKPNALGLYDLHGNVLEWCLDIDGVDRILRGGSWYGEAEYYSAGRRAAFDLADREDILGFRLLLSSANG